MATTPDYNYQNLNTTYTQPQPNPAQTEQPATNSTVLGLDVKSSTFWTGAAIGAGLTLLATNETVQKTVVKTFSKIMAAAAGGVEELKEKYQDAKAEVDAESTEEK